MDNNNNNKAFLVTSNHKDKRTTVTSDDYWKFNSPSPPDPHHIHQGAYYKGYKDFRADRQDNPYIKDTLLAKEWQRGWNAAYSVNLRKLNDGSLIREWYKDRKTLRRNKSTSSTQR